jgi:type IV pilus assembly protein PilA
MKPVVQNKKQTIRQQGFTLLELMVVLAIIGILATVGATQFQNYIARARTTEGLQMAQPFKLAIEERISTGDGVFTQEQLGVPTFIATADVTDITVKKMEAGNNGGVIIITFGPRVGEDKKNTLTLTPIVTAGAIRWFCSAGEVKAPENANGGFVAGTLPAKFAPANCQG